MKVKGFDELKKRLDNLAKLDGQNVPLLELLTPDFVSRHTQYKSADELFQKSGFKIKCAEDFKGIPNQEWNSYIRSVSKFGDWDAMLSKAGEEFVIRALSS